MPMRRYKTKLERFTLASVELERSQFSRLLQLNPNYFGMLPHSTFKSVAAIKGNTTYEEIGCIGYHPEREELRATVVVKQPYGYSGSEACNGSREHVRFYLWDGANWIDQGIASFTAYNIPEATEGHKDLDYAVRVNIDPTKKLCSVENFMRVRAILSWKQAPPENTPDWTPIWGEVQEATIQIDKAKFMIWGDIFKSFELNIPLEMNKFIPPSVPVEFKKAEALDAFQVIEKYASTEVEPKRFLAPMLKQAVLNDDFALSNNILDIVGNFDIAIDLDDWLNSLGDGNTNYEDLHCVGYDSENGELTAIIRIKKKAGYSGNLCSAGSKEYVAFWLDSNNDGIYGYLGTGNVNVYDFHSWPDGGLYYAVSIPVNFENFQSVCGENRVLHIRAILSWNDAPPTGAGDYNWVPTYGNREDILISPKPALEIVPFGVHRPILESIGNIAPFKINLGTGLASGSLISNPTSVADKSPFGDLVTIQGYITHALNITNVNSTPLRYKIEVKPSSNPDPNSWEALINSFKLDVNVINMTTGNYITETINQQTDSQNFFNYQEDLSGNEWRRPIGNILAYWYTSGKEGLWDLRVTATNGISTWLSEPLRLMLDNTAPTMKLIYTNDCGDEVVGSHVTGQYEAEDKYLSTVTFIVKPNANAGQFIQPPASTHGASISRNFPVPASDPHTYPAPQMGTWEFDTTGLEPCGYLLEVYSYERTIVNNGFGSRYGYDVISFCLREA